MNTRIIRFLFCATIAGTVAVLLLILPMGRPAHASGGVTNCTEGGLDAALAGGGTVTFNCNGNNSPATINITSQKTISVTTTIDGSNGGNTVAIGSVITPTRIFSVTSGTALTLTNLIVQSGYELNGGCIYANGSLTLNQVQVTNCTATGNGGGKGGAIFVNNGGSVALINTSVLTNTAGALGGGIFDSGTLTVTNSYFSYNYAMNSGGGIYIDSGAVSVTITNTSLSGNSAFFSNGGGIYNFSTLTVNNSTFSGNDGGNLGGGIYNFGALMVNNSTFSGNFATSNDGGGGIYNSTTMTVNNTAFNSNIAAKGGGITNIGVATLTSVTILSNTVTGIGGGIFNSAGTLTLSKSTLSGNSATNFAGAGGGIFNTNTGTLTVTNSTISGNSATNSGLGGGMFNDAIAYLTGVTLSGNNANLGGGIFQDTSFTQTVTLRNTIIAKGSLGGNCYASGSAPITSNGYNLSSDGSCSTYLNQTGDLNNTNPNLGPLANNGGSTQTHALLPGSPAIDEIPVGTNGCGTIFTTDQRGVPRPQGARCDIGAFEGIYKFLFLPLILR